MFEILSALVHDVEMALRQSISERLAKLDGVPRDLAVFLANDEVSIAVPMLSESNALLDEDLIKIIHSRSVEHQLAITNRPAVSESVSDALVEEGDEGVICSMLLNQNTKISSATFAYLAEQSKRVSAFQGPILNRNELDPKLAKRMFTWVSMALKQQIIDNFELDSGYVDTVIEQSVMQEFALGHNSSDWKPAEQKLVQELDRSGQLSPETMVLALQQGEVRLFVSMFQKITDIPSDTIMEMLSEREGKGLAIACRSASLGKAIISPIFAVMAKKFKKGELGLRRDLRKLLSLYDRISLDAANKIVGRWREHADYRGSIQELELT